MSVRQIPTHHRFGRKCDQQHGDERDCASSSPPVSAASQPAAQCQHSDYYPSCGNLLLSFVVLIASVRGNLSVPAGSRKLRVTRQSRAAVQACHAAAVSLWLSHCIAAPAPNPVPIRWRVDLAVWDRGCLLLTKQPTHQRIDGALLVADGGAFGACLAPKVLIICAVRPLWLFQLGGCANELQPVLEMSLYRSQPATDNTTSVHILLTMLDKQRWINNATPCLVVMLKSVLPCFALL